MAGVSLQMPQISQAEMLAFFEAHFSKLATDHFESHFLRPNNDQPPIGDTANCAEHDGTAEEQYIDEEYYYEEEENDGLGHYPDGVKRTLTDEQIAMFRYSELQALLRKNEQEQSTKLSATPVDELSEGELSDNFPSAPRATGPAPTKKKKRRKKNKNGSQKNKDSHETDRHEGEGAEGESQPMDLRKRTWDVVDKGLATLDYGEEEHEQQPAPGNPMQRRRISYDD
ncbi:hypothetical protein QBC46DRAFT_116728 [Diplogelasinospora grovesii]|uniref:Uncharacterized protein n=1 Tax=Diplogelasinospora grovesii TaxID=303347 RepID=A0AAN6NGG4_9PEZI|nr:hypothetical protein QBC46DRAFT_116728 [Diplogelasinospora grovesii]